MTHTHDEIMAMDADALNEAIYRAQGYEKLDWPAVPRWQKPDWLGCLYDEPDYARDIAAAWNLFEEMGHGAYIRHEINGYGDKWHCSFDVPSWYSENTAPLAICRAWLIWKAAQ